MKGISLEKIRGKTRRKRRRIRRKLKGINSKTTSYNQDLLMKIMVKSQKLRRKAKKIKNLSRNPGP